MNSPKKAGLPGYTSVASTDALESGRIAHGTSKEAFIDRSEEADDDAGDGETLLARADSNSSSSSPIANYNYPPSSKNTCRCYRASRLVGRINIMKEVPIPEGQEHPKYPGLRTRIVWVIPSGWQMLWVTFGAIIVFPIVVFSTMHAIPAVQYGMPFNILTMIVAAVSLGRTTFKDPGIFPRYMSPQGPDWALCQKTNSYRCVDQVPTLLLVLRLLVGDARILQVPWFGFIAFWFQCDRIGPQELFTTTKVKL